MSRTSKILTTAAFAAAVSLATIGSAFAQAAAGGGGGNAPGGPPGAGTPGQSPVITYGTPGNCPPTIAGCSVPDKPKVVKPRKVDNCGDYPRGSVARRECLAKQQ